MIADLKPYSEYTESGLPWLGSVPRSWTIARNGRLFAQRNQTGFGELPILEVSLKTGVTVREFASSTRKQIMSDRAKYKRAVAGDIAYNMMRMWQGALGRAPVDGLVSPAYVVVRPWEGTDTRYFSYLFRTTAYQQEVNNASRGIVPDRNRLYWVDFKKLPSPCPPPDEQAAIVQFLDHANGRVERAIRAKRKLIALLNEQKQAIIHRAVTRGLDPDVKLKPSGISWLGDVPQHWEVAPLKGVCNIQSGVTLGKYYIGEHLTEFPYLRVANVQAGRLDFSNVKTLYLPLRDARRSMLQIGDVLMTEGGDADKLGRGCVWNGEVRECVHQNHIFAVRPDRNRLIPQFLAALLGSNYAKLYFLRTAKQTTNLASTNKTTIGQFRVVLPKVEEQVGILNGLETQLRPVVFAISRTEREIALLREYRTRLTADVVTGKLDVREAARGVPQEQRVDEATRGAEDNEDMAETAMLQDEVADE